jgi:hypothetical protein
LSDGLDLSGLDTVFCDSADALRAAEVAGLPADCRVLTASPFLQNAFGARTVFLRGRLEPQAIAAIEALRPEIQQEALHTAHRDPVLRDYGQVAALTLLTSLDFVSLAACLDEADCVEPRLIVRVDTGNAHANAVYNGPWDQLLAVNPLAQTVTFPVAVRNFDTASWGAPRGLRDRLRVASWRRVAFQVLFGLASRWPGWSGREAILVSDNELLQETAFALMLRGWALRRGPTGAKPAALDDAERDGLWALCRSVISPCLEGRVVAPVREPLLALIGDRLLSAAAMQKGAAAAFDRFIAGLSAERRRVALANFPSRSSTLGVWHAASQRNIPMFGFQHSVSCEICEGHEATFSTYEVFSSDRAYTYNDSAAETYNNIPDRHATAIAVGMPGDFRQLKRRRTSLRRRRVSIAFVSTAVYSGYWGRLTYGTRTDAGMLDFELRMLNDVFAGLRHDVLYTRYPTVRLLDADPAPAAARSARNIKVFSDLVDLRYLINDCDVLVTARATSTLSWCLMSDRPLVFVDIQDDMRLRPVVRQAFAAGLFLFSTAEPGWEARLRRFLDRPIVEIELEWQAKAESRRELVRLYFDKGGPAGWRAARDIDAFSRQTMPVAQGLQLQSDMAVDEVRIGAAGRRLR